MRGSDWAVVAVAVIGLIGAWFSARSARAAAEYSAKASVANQKAEAETEAYNRARKMDVETIQRQDAEIAELVEENRELKIELSKIRYEHHLLQQAFREQQDEVNALKRHVARLSAEKELKNGKQHRSDDQQ